MEGEGEYITFKWVEYLDEEVGEKKITAIGEYEGCTINIVATPNDMAPETVERDNNIKKGFFVLLDKVQPIQ